MAYEKQTWKTGDIITESKLNHIEDGIANAGASSSEETIELLYVSGGYTKISGSLVLFGGSGSISGGKTVKDLIGNKKIKNLYCSYTYTDSNNNSTIIDSFACNVRAMSNHTGIYSNLFVRQNDEDTLNSNVLSVSALAIYEGAASSSPASFTLYAVCE